jgi:hypothetical protein
MSIFESIFENQASSVKDPTHTIQCSPLIVLYFENRNRPEVRLKKKAFSVVLCVNFNL